MYPLGERQALISKQKEVVVEEQLEAETQLSPFTHFFLQALNSEATRKAHSYKVSRQMRKWDF